MVDDASVSWQRNKRLQPKNEGARSTCPLPPPSLRARGKGLSGGTAAADVKFKELGWKSAAEKRVPTEEQ